MSCKFAKCFAAFSLCDGWVMFSVGELLENEKAKTNISVNVPKLKNNQYAGFRQRSVKLGLALALRNTAYRRPH